MTPSTFSFPNLSRLVPAVILGVAVLLGGCDTTSNVTETDDTPAVETAALSDGVTALSTAASLSDDQARTLRERLAKYDGNRTPGVLWSVAADVHENLTNEQIEALKTRIQEHRAERRQHGSREGQRGHVRRALRYRLGKLDLSDAQKKELRALRGEYRDEMQSLRQACRAGTLSETDAEAWQALRTEMREAFRNVLTEEQHQQINTRREKRLARRDKVGAARAAALHLTNEQRAQFDGLRAQFDDPGTRLLRRCNRDERSERPIASILTADQREIVMVHRVLRHGVMRAHQHRGPRG